MEGPDQPFLKGTTKLSTELPVRGIMLNIHGCNGLGAPWYTNMLGEFFTAHGFHYFAPDSFADPRPPEICGMTPPALARQHAEMFKLRLAQTQRTLVELRKTYPALPIYVWGHSEGGAIAQYLDADVAGIVLSGASCGTNGQRIVAARKTPIVYMAGERDPYVVRNRKLTAKEISKCRRYLNGNKMKAHVIEQNRHDIYPWRADVANALLDFMGVSDRTDGRVFPKPGFVAINAEQNAALAKYREKKNSKAFAVGTNGYYYWTEAWEYRQDAELFALYKCSTDRGKQYFRLTGQACWILESEGEGKANGYQ
jgi:dienelactone hydrolase